MYFALMYTISMGLDAFDGMLARACDQCSKFGYYADMIIDRISSVMALMLAADVLHENKHPWAPVAVPFFYVCVVTVELLSHGVVCYYAEFKGVHQKKLGHDYVIVQWYLDNKTVLLWACVTYEALPLAIIADIPYLPILAAPGFVFRAIANMVRLYACWTMDTESVNAENSSESEKGK